MHKIIAWLEHRTGLETAIKNFLYEEIPASSGWHQIIGSMAVFSFLVQVFTGILLAVNYAPTPGESYLSLKYIMTELTGGKLIHGLHHWGATLMIVIVVLHMIQVFVYGAYKKPREATWMLGVVLLLVTLAYGLTGYLLPWDNRAYWGTVVTLQIAASAPVAGPYLARLLGGANGIGVVTFARFYAVHVLLLPPITMLLIAIHIYLVRKHGVAPAVDDTQPRKKFFPEQVFKDTVGIFFGFAFLVMLAIFVQTPLERLADPTDTSYIPRPGMVLPFSIPKLEVLQWVHGGDRGHRAPHGGGSNAFPHPVYRSGADAAPAPTNFRHAGGSHCWAWMGGVNRRRRAEHSEAGYHRRCNRGNHSRLAVASARTARGAEVFPPGKLQGVPSRRGQKRDRAGPDPYESGASRRHLDEPAF